MSRLLFSQPAMTIEFDVLNDWEINVNDAIITEPGNNYTGNYTSESQEVIISHLVKPPGQYRNHSWTIEVNKEDSNWHPLLELWIRRTGDGYSNVNPNQCVESIVGGTNFQKIDNIPLQFYSGRCERNDVPIQFELRNVSVLTPADSYQTDIVYTITITVP